MYGWLGAYFHTTMPESFSITQIFVFSSKQALLNFLWHYPLQKKVAIYGSPMWVFRDRDTGIIMKKSILSLLFNDNLSFHNVLI